MPRFAYKGHEEVAEIVRNGQAGKDYVIVDVRDSDRAGGHITASRNYPSEYFHDRLDDLIKETKDVPKVIFHCALSQQRGPKAARIYAEEVTRRGARVQLAFEKEADAQAAGANKTAANESPSPNIHAPPEESKAFQQDGKAEQEVIVLRGGFTEWQQKYKNDPKLVEKWDASVWSGYQF